MRTLMAVAVAGVASTVGAEEQRDPVLCTARQVPIVLEHRDDGRVVAHVEFAAPAPTACDAFKVRGVAWDLQRCVFGVCEPVELRHAIVRCGSPRAPRTCPDPSRVYFRPRGAALYVLRVDAQLLDGGFLSDVAHVRSGRRPARAR